MAVAIKPLLKPSHGDQIEWAHPQEAGCEARYNANKLVSIELFIEFSAKLLFLKLNTAVCAEAQSFFPLAFWPYR